MANDLDDAAAAAARKRDVSLLHDAPRRRASRIMHTPA
jgi:hypothetical protein